MPLCGPLAMNQKHVVKSFRWTTVALALCVGSWAGSVFAQPAPGGPAPGGPAPGGPAPANPGPAATDLPPPPPPPTTTARPPLMPTLPPPAQVPVEPKKENTDRPTERGAMAPNQKEVFAEDWWTRTKPVFDIHGYFRVRSEMFHNFSLGRADPSAQALWPRPLDDSYKVWTTGTDRNIVVCGDNPTAFSACKNKTQAGANMRFRLDPEIHISDNLRIISQIDLLDNLVMGSTPNGYYNEYVSGRQVVGAQTPYAPRSAYTTTQEVPVAGQNSLNNSVSVKRVWGEYMTPVGLLRFGRMGNHWGLGILANSGDGYDSDYQSTMDRIMFITGLKSLDLYFGAAWDFPNEGATSASRFERQGQPYDLAQLDDVNQWVFVLVRRRAADLAKQDLAKGRPVLNGGVFTVYRKQTIANDAAGSANDAVLGALPSAYDDMSKGYVRRKGSVWIPDLWGQILYRKFRFEFEAVAYLGSLENTDNSPGATGDYKSINGISPNGWKIRQYMFATQTEIKAVEDKLRVNFGFGWSSGDPDLDDGSIHPSELKLQPQRTYDRTFSMARFHPDYRVDLILFRNILSRVQGAYYFRPSVDYDFIRYLNGQKFGGGAAVIWSRASEFVQTPGHHRDLGLELDVQLYYQAKDGSLNDNPDKMGGFFTMLQYGVLFPLGGLGYQKGEETKAIQNGVALDTSAAQVLRWYLGIMF